MYPWFINFDFRLCSFNKHQHRKKYFYFCIIISRCIVLNWPLARIIFADKPFRCTDFNAVLKSKKRNCFPAGERNASFPSWPTYSPSTLGFTVECLCLTYHNCSLLANNRQSVSCAECRCHHKCKAASAVTHQNLRSIWFNYAWFLSIDFSGFPYMWNLEIVSFGLCMNWCQEVFIICWPQ